MVHERDEFYQERIKDLRLYLICENISTMIFQLFGLLQPLNDKHFTVSCLYTLNSIVCLILQILSFKGGKFVKLVLVNNFLLIMRMALRLLDFEETYEHLGRSEWTFLVMGNTMNIVMACILNFCAVDFSVP